jgi:hypothetical protein
MLAKPRMLPSYSHTGMEPEASKPEGSRLPELIEWY